MKFMSRKKIIGIIIGAAIGFIAGHLGKCAGPGGFS